MMINTNALVSITEANQNFSKVARLVDERGSAVILKNNVPRYLIVEFSQAEQLQTAPDEDVMEISAKLIRQNQEAGTDAAPASGGTHRRQCRTAGPGPFGIRTQRAVPKLRRYQRLPLPSAKSSPALLWAGKKSSVYRWQQAHRCPHHAGFSGSQRRRAGLYAAGADRYHPTFGGRRSRIRRSVELASKPPRRMKCPIEILAASGTCQTVKSDLNGTLFRCAVWVHPIGTPVSFILHSG